MIGEALGQKPISTRRVMQLVAQNQLRLKVVNKGSEKPRYYISRESIEKFLA
jgi:hypothetical protein